MKTPRKFALLAALAAVSTAARAGEPLFTDDFSSASLSQTAPEPGKPGWKILRGKFSTDGSDAAGNYKPVAGQLNFGIESGTAVAIDLNDAEARAFRSIDFQLRQSNEAQNSNHLFTVRLEDTSMEGGYYDAKLSLNPSYFNTTGFGGYAYKTLEKTGIQGEALQMAGSAFETVAVRFDPAVGTVVSVNGFDVLEIPNKFDLDKINRITLINETGMASWFVDDVIVSRE